MKQGIRGILAILALLCLCSCVSTGNDPEVELVSRESAPVAEQVEDSANTSENFSPYVAPAFADSVFHSEEAQGEEGVLIDVSAVSDGYVGVSAQSDGRLKCQVILGDATYNYNLDSDGTPSIFPLQSGNGLYTVQVVKEVTEGKYAKVYGMDVDVALKDEFQPFLRPSQYVPYSSGSLCVAKAGEVAASQGDALGVVGAIFDYICENVTYDKELAQTVAKSYLPVPDRTLESGKGICFDYASLAAAMLRSQGIPTKMVFGYVQPDDLYHAWNMFYTEESGWVAVQYEVESNSWNRLDPTFIANGAGSEFVGNGTNYADVYYY